MICFQISIFEPLGTIWRKYQPQAEVLWFAFKLVSLNHWEQCFSIVVLTFAVVICFQISIFEPLGTIAGNIGTSRTELWFAFKLVSLNHWEQYNSPGYLTRTVVICFQISIFEPLGTIYNRAGRWCDPLWFAFKLVSLNHWEQLCLTSLHSFTVVICFQISIFEPLGTIRACIIFFPAALWFAFKLVSLNHWEQSLLFSVRHVPGCDLLSN